MGGTLGESPRRRALAELRAMIKRGTLWRREARASRYVQKRSMSSALFSVHTGARTLRARDPGRPARARRLVAASRVARVPRGATSRTSSDRASLPSSAFVSIRRRHRHQTDADEGGFGPTRRAAFQPRRARSHREPCAERFPALATSASWYPSRLSSGASRAPTAQRSPSSKNSPARRGHLRSGSTGLCYVVTTRPSSRA